ncbi:hypothetical protein GCM10007385_14870 [Tateyamaria omphalii]|nr:MGMT family protein [Tateyamaria omphalii]GGX48081.1 hypothetical protein GCM10007385_14870 [Tateyamaria omphalii]
MAITALLEGDRTNLSFIACDFEDIGPFAALVCTATPALAPGETSTYGAIAIEVGEKHQAREVGQALGQILVPSLFRATVSWVRADVSPDFRHLAGWNSN